jgi:Fe-S oxidoreductase
MDRNDFIQLEKKCIQEELPYCTAACPLHVDARGFLKQARLGEWQEARKILDRVMPLSGILGRICDHPCEKVCKRAEAGDPISIAALERFCVKVSSSQQRIQVLPSRDAKVAVLGDGLDILTASSDLLRKGYGVTLFCAQADPGRGLATQAENLLSYESVEEELARLKTLGLEVNSKVEFSFGFYETVREQFDAVFVGSEASVIRDLSSATDPVTLETNRAGVFSAGFKEQGANRSPIKDAARGRKAAVSIDRYLQKTSLTAGREKEGPSSTRLYTSLMGVKAQARVAMANPSDGYNGEEATEEAKRCLQCECMECVKACEYLEHFKGYPKTYARDVYNSETAVTRSRKANSLINSCMLCGQCEEICPHDFSMADFCLEARRRLVQKGKMPATAHEFALRDMLFSNSKAFALSRHEPGTEKSAYLFFPGCQLSGSAPHQVEKTYAHLRARLPGGVGLMLRCCGAPADWSGRTELFESTLQELADQWTELGEPRLIAACSTCYSLFKKYLPRMKLISLWEALEMTGLPQPVNLEPVQLSVHDPCTARHEKGIQESVRRLLTRMGHSIDELTYSGLLTECCGYGGLVSNANPDLARDVAKRRAMESPTDYVAYCSMCRDSLAAAGKRVVHVLDLIWESVPGADPGTRKSPGYSERHQNRARLKRELLLKLWNERPQDMETFEKIVLDISPEVRGRMEKRRILVEDVQQVIEHAERTGRKLQDPKTGHWLAYYAPTTATYWVEYSPSGDTFHIHNVYSHRMQIVEERSA